MTDNEPIYVDWSDPQEQAKFLAQQRIKNSEIPKRYQCRSFGDYIPRAPHEAKLLEAMRGYTERALTIDGFTEPSGVLIFGPPGTGKTHLACACLTELIHKGAKGLYLSPVDWFSRIRSTYNDRDSEESEIDILDETGDVPVLLIDDLGVGKEGAEWQAEKLYQLINRRLNNGKPTLITTNHKFPDELERYCGRRVTSRLKEICMVFNTAKGEDYRGTRKAV